MARTTISLVLFLLLLLSHVSYAGNTVCATGQLDWYTSVVGESPCETYQRLRQICNKDYQVPSMSVIPPGDQCHEQVAVCCCNTVAFQLSMLCLNCQHDASPLGIDASPGTYHKYLDQCGPGTTNGLPPGIQSAVCNAGIRLDDFLYKGWNNGAWFYSWTEKHTSSEHATHGNNTFTHCSNQASSSVPETSTVESLTTVNPSQTTQPNSSAQPADGTGAGGNQTASANAASAKSSPSGGTIAGVVIGVLAILAIAVFTLWFGRKYQRNARRAARPLVWNRFWTGGRQMAPVSTGKQEYTVPPSPPPSSGPLFSPDAMVRAPVRRDTPSLQDLPPATSRTVQWVMNAGTIPHETQQAVLNEPRSLDPSTPLRPLRLEPEDRPAILI